MCMVKMNEMVSVKEFMEGRDMRCRSQRRVLGRGRLGKKVVITGRREC